MAVDMFIKITGITGEAQDTTHKDEIDVLAWSWGMSQSGTMHTGSGGGGGKVSVQDLSLTKWIDKSSPILMMYVSNGAQVKEAKLTVRKAGATPVEYVVITMEDVIVTSLSTGGSGGEDRLTENVTLNFARVKLDYQPQNQDGTKLGGPVPYGWDIAKNVKTI